MVVRVLRNKAIAVWAAHRRRRRRRGAIWQNHSQYKPFRFCPAHRLGKLSKHGHAIGRVGSNRAEANYRLARRWNLPGGWWFGRPWTRRRNDEDAERFGIAIVTALLTSPFAAQGQGIPVGAERGAAEGSAAGGPVGGAVHQRFAWRR